MSSFESGSHRLLVVDDQPDVTSAIKLGLEGRGFIIDAYNDPLVALSSFEPGVYGVALLDIRMPKMTGFELYRQLRKIDPGLRVCFFTGFDLYKGEFEKMFPDLKAKAFFRKPIRIDELATKLHDLLLDGGQAEA